MSSLSIPSISSSLSLLPPPPPPPPPPSSSVSSSLPISRRFGEWIKLATTVLLLFLATASGEDSLEGFHQVPRINIQFICGHDVRPEFNVTSLFEGYYNQFLDDLKATRFRSSVKFVGMKDIPPTKFYYPACNMSSPQVLTALRIDGWVELDPTSAPDYENDDNSSNEDQYPVSPAEELSLLFFRDVNAVSLEDYFAANACDDITFFHAKVDEWVQTENALQQHHIVEADTYLLCGGASDPDYLDEEPPDSGFLILGFMVGMVMVAMILGELQKFENRPPPRSRRRINYAPTMTQEVEMT